MSDPIAYLIAERREGLWCLGDDWTSRRDTLAEAQVVAEEWRRAKWYSADPGDVAVFAIVMVDPDPKPDGHAGRQYWLAP